MNINYAKFMADLFSPGTDTGWILLVLICFYISIILIANKVHLFLRRREQIRNTFRNSII